MSARDPVLDSALQEAGWLGRLARSLVKNEDRAEEAVQDTLVVALERTGEAPSSPRAWLGGILRNKLRQAARARGRRAVHEQRVERPHSVPSAHDVNERLEVQALLLEAVRGLEEPYRSTIVARFFDGLRPREIARRQGQAVRTVNTRLERGLAHLRARLDGRFNGDRSTWLRALLPFAGAPQDSAWKRLGEGLGMGATAKAAAGLVVVAGVLWFGRALREPEGHETGTMTTATPSGRSASPASQGYAVVGDGEPLASTPTAAQRTVVESQASSCLVRVVEAGTGKPLPDARLWIQREDVDRDGPEWCRAMWRFNDVEPVLAGGLGLELALDEGGEVRVPRPARELSLAAARGELHGEATLEPGAAECVVELRPYHALTVEVVDRAGEPVPGALIEFFWGELNPLEGSNTLPTDEDGRLATPKLENQIHGHTNRGPVRLTLAGGVPCEPEMVEFTLENVPTGPVRFVAGDFGSVEVQLTDPQGRALALEGTAYLDLFMIEPTLTLWAGGGLERPLEGGRALFACVGLDRRLDVGCAPNAHADLWREVIGLSTPGQELRVLIPVGERRLIARGRVVGVPAPGTLTARAPVPSIQFQERIGGEGAFELALESGDVSQVTGPWFLKLERRGEPALGTNVVPRVDAEQRVVDFGDVVLEPLAALAHLSVVDEGGAPIASAWIEARSRAGSERRWSDEHGRCVLAGRVEDLPWRVAATHDDWLASDWLEITAPETEATLTLRRGATLEGRILLPRRANEEACNLELTVARAAVGRVFEYHGDPCAGGRFRFQACEPGIASLSVVYDGQWVVERAGIELVAGATTQLPEIDLGTLLHPLTLTVELASGAPWLGGHLQVLDEGGELANSIVVGPSARVFLLAPRPTLDLWVAGRGARATRFEGVVDGDRLVLPDAPSVVLRLAHEVPLPTPPLALVVWCLRTEPEEVAFETDDEADGADAQVGADGLVRLSAPWPGEYTLDWCVRHTGTGTEFDLEQEELQTVTIDESTAGSVVDALLTPSEVEEAVLAATGR